MNPTQFTNGLGITFLQSIQLLSQLLLFLFQFFVLLQQLNSLLLPIIPFSLVYAIRLGFFGLSDCFIELCYF